MLVFSQVTEPININSISVKTSDGSERSLSYYNGKVLLIVNVASYCGYTPQYAELQKIYEIYKPRGFEILAFPCNDFGNQEPGTLEEIKTFCQSKYNVTFEIFDKVTILGPNKSELYTKLVKYPPEGDISWNFEKFIVDKKGNVVARFKSKIKPDSPEITNIIEAQLKIDE
ncbi:MAG: glutathione peroxidase [Ignavibacteria bacterium]